MAATPMQVREALEKYTQAWSNKDKTLLLSIFAADASVADPAGTPEFRGHDGIARFWEAAHDGSKRQLTMKLEEIRACGSEGILRFTIQIRLPEKNQGLDLSVIEYMALNDEGKIQTLRAFWDEKSGSCPPGMTPFIPDISDAYEK